MVAASSAALRVNSRYSGLGLRTRKTVSRYDEGVPFLVQQQRSSGTATAAAGTWTSTANIQFVYDAQGRLLGEYNAIGNTRGETVWFNGQPVAAMVNGVLHYVSADHLGTPRSLVRASSGQEVWRWDSDPFGTSLPSNPVAGAAVTYSRCAQFGVNSKKRRMCGSSSSNADSAWSPPSSRRIGVPA